MNMPSTSRRRITLILCFSVIFSFASGFRTQQSKNIVHHTSRKAQILLSTVKEDEMTEKTPEERFQQRLKERSQRCVDYPSFAYKSEIRYPAPKPKLTQPEFVQKVDMGERSPSISTRKELQGIDPDIGTPSEKGNNILLTLFSWYSSLEGDLFQNANSAKRTRLLNERAYAKSEPFTPENLAKPPTLDDLSPPLSSKIDTFWIGTPARLISLGIPYYAFPYIIRFLGNFVTMPPAQLDDIVSKFGPGIAILYGTFVSLTLSILYNRQQSIQENVAKESSLVTLIVRDLLSLFRRDQDLAIEAGQCAADHIRTLVRGSRGGELMLLLYSDPFARMNELIDKKEEMFFAEGKTNLDCKGSLISSCRDTIKDLHKLRAERLSRESLALPPTHFFILSVLTLLILLGYSINILPSVDANAEPPNESSVLFAFLFSTYVLFYNFAQDLNNPFQGVYQVRRSSTAVHLLEAKWLISNHPLLKGQVDFNEVTEEDDGNVIVRSPGLGDLLLERCDIYPDTMMVKDLEADDQ